MRKVKAFLGLLILTAVFLAVGKLWAIPPLWKARERPLLWKALLRPIAGGDAKAAAIDVTPSMDRFKNAFDGFWRGGAGGLVCGLGMALLGAPLGTAAGALVAAAVLGGDAGKVIAVVGGFEAAQSLFVGAGNGNGQ